MEILNWILFSAVCRVCSCWQYSVEVLKLHVRLQGIWQLSALDSDALHLFSFDLIRCNSIYLLSPLVLLLLLPRNQQKLTKNNNNNNEWKIDACTIWQKLTNEKRKTTNNKMSKNENKNKNKNSLYQFLFQNENPFRSAPASPLRPPPCSALWNCSSCGWAGNLIKSSLVLA